MARRESEGERKLQEHAPCLRYDSREKYVATSPDAMVAMTCASGSTVLRNETGGQIAAAAPAPAEITLSLELLVAEGTRYPGLECEAAPSDYLDAPAPAGPDAAALPDVSYGRAIRRGAGWWLQYWFFYTYNEVPEGQDTLLKEAARKLRLGRHTLDSAIHDDHQGDWEMVQIGLDGSGEIDSVVTAQHDHGETANRGSSKFSDLEFDPANGIRHLVIYPARGTHASYFTHGKHYRAIANLVDHNDGQGRLVKPDVVDLEGGTCPWVDWPGRWGSSQEILHAAGSPSGPKRQSKWSHPDVFQERGKSHIHLARRVP